MDDLVRQALREGRLTVAGGGPAALYTPWAARFEKRYPGITGQVRGSVQHPARRRHRPAAGKRRSRCRRGDPANVAGLRAVEGGGRAAQHRYPGRHLDIAPPPGLAPLAELNVANGFLAFITQTAVAQAYRDRFAALIGPVTGPEYR